jgi:hypothetical protein
MEKKVKEIHPDQWLKDLSTETPIQTFGSEEMIECEKCGRKSPPTRLKCLYCGTELKVSSTQTEFIKPSLRKLEDWEKGFNLIFQPSESNSEKFEEVADLLHLEKESVKNILENNLLIPLARTESKTEAEVLLHKLKKLKVESKIISDENLNLKKMPRRLRGVEFYEDRLILILFNADEIAEIPFAEISLIVTGAYFERKIEATESLKKKDERKILESAEISTDEILIDIYSRDDSLGYRIESKGFDFSCLDKEKTLFAKENMPKLVNKLRLVAAKAQFDDNYLKVRTGISKVWTVSERNDSLGLKRQGIIGLKRTNVTTVSNLIQFTRYSRMLWQLL